MRQIVRVLAFAAALGVAGCSGDSTGPSTTQQSIAGSYGGVIQGLSQGVLLDATFSLTLTQNAGSLGGSYALQGTLTDGVDIVDVQGTGTLTGTVGSGSNPSVSIVVKTAACPNYQAQFSGAYDGTNRRLTITGPIEFFAAGTCNVVLTYPTTLILTR